MLYDAAFIYNNVSIYEPPEFPIKADEYCLNFMWINKDKISIKQEFLFGDYEEFQNKFVIPISRWAKKNSGVSINIWVDGKMATEGAIDRSRIALLSELEETSRGRIHFRDVRSIELVHSNPMVFSEKMPIYFRVDLLRAIAANHVFSKKENKFFVYGDIDMEPLSGSELFDKRTVDYLNDFGIVMAKKRSDLYFENGFQILNGENSQLLDSHRKVIIDLNIKMALQKPDQIEEQQIFSSYRFMATHFLKEDGRYGKLLYPPFSTDKYLSMPSIIYNALPFEEGPINLFEIMPRKPVDLPPSHFFIGGI